MSMVINTNMPALNAVRLLNDTKSEQSTAMERLTSGLRINKAADDAAGLAVSTGMTTQIMGTEQGIRNANDGISLVQTVDGASDEVVNMLQRMRELSVQSLNGTYSSENRVQMDTEYQQLTLEIDRVAKTTRFNDNSLMLNLSSNGQSFASTNPSSLDIHVGWQTGEDNKIAISVANFQVSTNSLTGDDAVSGMYGNSTANSVTTTELGLASAGTLLYGKASEVLSGGNTYYKYATLNQTNITSVAGASAAVHVLDGTISNISDFRAKWGALQNRIESTISNLSNVNENMNAARSRIMDADFAQESANLSRTQVLQQAGMSMLSQANQQSQNVMQLLQ